MELISKYTAEAGHWYTEKGDPAYTIIGKNGNERATTLRDARKLGYKPSVTMILREAAKPGLDNWKIEQNILASLTLPRIEDETEQDYIKRIRDDAKQQAIKAAERGIEIHKWIQQGFEGVNHDIDSEAWKYYYIAYTALNVVCCSQVWTCEQSFSTEKYGGKIDLHCPKYLFDIKTKESIKDAKTWDEHAMQIAAYQEGIGHTGIGGILFVSTTEIDANVVLIEPEKIERGWFMFRALVDYWYAKTGLK